jgi:dolichol-phosphate mannosyltransferase
MVLHLAALGTLIKGLHLPFMKAQAIATACAILGNYCLNNEFTYKDQRLAHGMFWKGLAAFVAICATGAWINFMLSRSFFEAAMPWWLAGSVGALVGGLWNYNITSFFVWRKRAAAARIDRPSAPSDATLAASASR